MHSVEHLKKSDTSENSKVYSKWTYERYYYDKIKSERSILL